MIRMSTRFRSAAGAASSRLHALRRAFADPDQRADIDRLMVEFDAWRERVEVALARHTTASPSPADAIEDRLRGAFAWDQAPSVRMTATEVAKAIGCADLGVATLTTVGRVIRRLTHRAPRRSAGASFHVMPPRAASAAPDEDAGTF